MRIRPSRAKNVGILNFFGFILTDQVQSIFKNNEKRLTDDEKVDLFLQKKEKSISTYVIFFYDTTLNETKNYTIDFNHTKTVDVVH